MRSFSLASCFLVGALINTHAWAATPEVPVCVEVMVRRPSAANAASKVQQHEAAGEASEGNSKPVAVKTAADSDNSARTNVPPGVAKFESGEDEPGSENGSSTQAAMVSVPNPAAGIVPAGATNSIADIQGDARMESGAHLPLGQAPEVYLKRLFEHFVTHERGFVAANEGCSQKIVVELYPLQVGWAAFARYTGTGREERVEQLLPTELSQFAQRASVALLHDVTIGEAVDRDNVLWSDSLHSTQKIRGRSHFVLGLGTRLRGGYFDTAVTDTSKANYGTVQRSLRLFSPMAVMSGYRGVFDQFGIEALAQFDLGTSQVAAKNNPAGGHVDYLGSLGLVLHVTRYADPRGISSIYYGGGATFELVWFNSILPTAQRYGDTRSTLMSGGLNADAVLGYEFMRASAVSFFLQGELNLPAYVLSSQNDAASIDTWFPGVKFALGANF